MTEKKKYDPPMPDKADKVHAAARSLLGTVPYAGAAASELLSIIIAPSLERRKTAWMEEVSEALRKLESQKKVVLEDLTDNEEFIDIVIEASNIAIRTSSIEKRQALKNALTNTALPNSIDSSLKNLFLIYIDTLTDWHIRLLHLFDDPPKYIEKNQIALRMTMGPPSALIDSAFPDMSVEREMCDSIWKDLYSRGLVNTESLNVTMVSQGIVARRTTEIARQFIRFIQSPIENDI